MSINSEIASDAFVITPSDSTNLTIGARAIYVGVGGDIKLRTLGVSGGAFSDVVFVGVPQGTILPVGVARVFATGTTATSLVGLR